jgi:hypothetical protein
MLDKMVTLLYYLCRACMGVRAYHSLAHFTLGCIHSGPRDRTSLPTEAITPFTRPLAYSNFCLILNLAIKSSV